MAYRWPAAACSTLVSSVPPEMTLQPRQEREAASCDPYAARDPARPIVVVGWPVYGVWAPPWELRSDSCQGLPEATILSRSVAEAQRPHARIAA